VIENLLLVAAGMIGGFIAGLTGIGTGIVMLAVIPLALVSYHVPDQHHVSVIIANAIFATLVSSLANMITTIKQRSFYIKETSWVALAAVLIAFTTFELIVKSAYYSKDLFNSIIVFFMFLIIFQTFKKLKLSNPKDEHVTKPRLLVTGASAGMVASLTGLGGGTVIIPLLNLWQRVDIKKAKSISFGSIMAISLWLTINNLFLEPPLQVSDSKGLIIFPMILPLSIGVLIGSPLGVLVSEKLSSKTISLVFLIMTSLVTIQKIAELIKLN
jgi:uncharacterized protein